MVMVTQTLNVSAFGDGGNGTSINDFTESLFGVQTTAGSDVTVDMSFLGDFESPFGGLGDEFGLNIEGNFFGWFTGDEYQTTTATFTISQAAWQTIISDGTITVTYDMGDGVQDFSFIYGLEEEFINLTFTWDDGTTPPTSPTPPSIITGTDAADHLPGTFRNDTIFGKGGDDGIYAKEGNDTVEGGAGNDSIYGGTGNDQLHGQAGDDRVFGGQGSDKIYGEMGDDILGGGQGDDQLFGGMGHDILYGGDNDDLLDGGMGNDVLFGGSGADTLWGGAGDDTLYGGGGADVFGFSANSGNDIIYGFGPGDAIDLDGQTYTANLDADGDLILALSGGGTVTLFGITAVDQDWFI